MYVHQWLCLWFSFPVTLLSGFGIREMLALQNEFGHLCSSVIFWKHLSRICFCSPLSLWYNSPVKPSGPGLSFLRGFLCIFNFYASKAFLLDCKEIQPIHPKGDQSWVFIGGTGVEAESPIFCSPDVKRWLIGKDSDAGKDWEQGQKVVTEDEMVGQHHWLDGHGFGWTPGVGDGQGGLACCGSCGCRVRHNWTTEVNWTEAFINMFCFFLVQFLKVMLLYNASIPSTFSILLTYKFS